MASLEWIEQQGVMMVRYILTSMLLVHGVSLGATPCLAVNYAYAYADEDEQDTNTWDVDGDEAPGDEDDGDET